jgi:uncharacterized Zn finger protein
MDLKIPRENESELLLYIWKIIDLPEITFRDLLYTISFELFLMTPEKTVTFIQKALKTNYLVRDSENNLRLSSEFQKKLDSWQQKRRQSILRNISQSKKQEETIKSLKKNKTTDFNTLIKAFTDKDTLNRAVTVTDASIKILNLDENKGIIEAKISGSKDEPYTIKIDANQQFLKHNCGDYVKKRAANKKFCKHLVKLFLMIKSRDENSTIYFLKKISENINNWEFIE